MSEDTGYEKGTDRSLVLSVFSEFVTFMALALRVQRLADNNELPPCLSSTSFIHPPGDLSIDFLRQAYQTKCIQESELKP